MKSLENQVKDIRLIHLQNIRKILSYGVTWLKKKVNSYVGYVKRETEIKHGLDCYCPLLHVGDKRCLCSRMVKIWTHLTVNSLSS